MKMGKRLKIKDSNIPFLVLAAIAASMGLWNLFADRILWAFAFFIMTIPFACIKNGEAE